MKTVNESIVGLWPNLFRAIEIAKNGNFSVSLLYDKDIPSCFNDCVYIKKQCNGFFNNFKNNGDIKIQISKPHSYSHSGSESFSDIQKRVDNVVEYKEPKTLLCDSCKSILDTAVKRLDLPMYRYEKIKEIALCIAKMEQFDKIQPQHIAEAIQYSFTEENIIEINL